MGMKMSTYRSTTRLGGDVKWSVASEKIGVEIRKEKYVGLE